MSPESAAALRYRPRPRPEWVRGANAMGRVIDWIEAGTIPGDRIQPVAYLDFFADPERGLEQLYAGLELPLGDASRRAMLDYVANKPMDKFGSHDYALPDREGIAAERERWRRIQDYFGVKSEL